MNCGRGFANFFLRVPLVYVLQLSCWEGKVRKRRPAPPPASFLVHTCAALFKENLQLETHLRQQYVCRTMGMPQVGPGLIFNPTGQPSSAAASSSSASSTTTSTTTSTTATTSTPATDSTTTTTTSSGSGGAPTPQEQQNAFAQLMQQVRPLEVIVDWCSTVLIVHSNLTQTVQTLLKRNS